MKIKIILSLLITVLFYATSLSQVKVDVETKVKREANQRANSRTDQAIDKGFDKLEEGIGKLFKKKNSFKGKIGIFDIKNNKINHRLNFYKIENKKLIEIF